MTKEERREFSEYWNGGTLVFAAIAAWIIGSSAAWKHFIKITTLNFPGSKGAQPNLEDLAGGGLYSYLPIMLVLIGMAMGVQLWVQKMEHKRGGAGADTGANIEAETKVNTAKVSGVVKARARGVLGSFLTIFCFLIAALLILKYAGG